MCTTRGLQQDRKPDTTISDPGDDTPGPTKKIYLKFDNSTNMKANLKKLQSVGGSGPGTAWRIGVLKEAAAQQD